MLLLPMRAGTREGGVWAGVRAATLDSSAAGVVAAAAAAAAAGKASDREAGTPAAAAAAAAADSAAVQAALVPAAPAPPTAVWPCAHLLAHLQSSCHSQNAGPAYAKGAAHSWLRRRLLRVT
eukprot:1138749-Pelagomonas_calceolata.AAC.4